MSSRRQTGSAGRIGIGDLTALFNQAYADYYVPIVLTERAFRDMVENFDLDLEASRLVTEASDPIAFAMLGVRGKRGWIGGMGVLPEHRGRGLGRVVMDAVSAEARSQGLASIDLEVLVQNTRASAIYESMGYTVVRDLDVWMRDGDSGPDVNAPSVAPASEHAVRPIPIEACLECHARMHVERAPWQRDPSVLARLAPSLKALGVGDGDEPRCWVVYRVHENSVRIADLALAEDADLAELHAVLERLIAEHPGTSASLVNLPSTDRGAAALEHSGFVARFRQREMRLQL